MHRILVACALLFSATLLHAQAWPCESPNGGYRECRIGSSGTIRLVMEMSDRQCFEGATWGTREGGVVWVDRGCRATFAIDNTPTGTRIVCESLGDKRHVCSAVTTHGVGLTRQLSKAECFEGQSWGYDPEQNTIWVDKGCRAEFTLSRPKAHPPAPPILDTPVRCESEDGKRKDCAADTSNGVQYVKQFSDDVCRFNQEWGYDDKGIWVTKGCRAEFVIKKKPAATVRAIVCESKGDARAQCPAETRYGVALVKRLDDSDCILGQSWGFDESGVWVAEGCKGQFALGGYRLPPEAVPATAMKLTCESLDGKKKQCEVSTARGVGLIHQLSETDCVLNRTWGYDPDGIWVTEGCRAEFVVAK